MQMVAAAKMQKAVSRVLEMRPYAHSAWRVLMNMSRAMKYHKHPLLETRPIAKVLIVVIASNRGLCGSFNASVHKKLREILADRDRLCSTSKYAKTNNECVADVLAIGKKAEKMALSLNADLIASFPGLMNSPNFDEARAVANMLVELYREKKYDKISVVYTDYISTLTQETKVRQVLPLETTEFEKQLAEIDMLGKEYGLHGPAGEYKIEPNVDSVLDAILPALLRAQLWHMILESNASKEASQMVAMKNATEAAGEIAEDLTLAYNRLRQAKITQEIAEISAGRAALE